MKKTPMKKNPLVTTANFASFLEKHKNNKRQYRFLLQSVASKLLRMKQATQGAKRADRTAVCLRHKTENGGVEIWQAIETGKARYGNLQTCGSVWACPVCAAKISEGRRIELTKGIMKWRKLGNEVLMITLTFSHSKYDKLQDIVNRLAGRPKVGITGAYRRLTSGQAYQTIKREWGIAGTVKGFEITHGGNGWHPHYHLLIFVEVKAAKYDDPLGLELEFVDLWLKSLAKEGLSGTAEHAVHVSLDDRDIDVYTTKWGIEHELTKAVNKEGRKSGRTPQALLRDYATGEDRAGDLWIEYVTVFKGRRQLQWSPGLKELLGVGEVEDITLAEEIKEDDILSGLLDDWEWLSIRKLRVRGLFLDWVTEFGLTIALVKLDDFVIAEKGSKPGILSTQVDLTTQEVTEEIIYDDDPGYKRAVLAAAAQKRAWEKSPARQKSAEGV